MSDLPIDAVGDPPLAVTSDAARPATSDAAVPAVSELPLPATSDAPPSATSGAAPPADGASPLPVTNDPPLSGKSAAPLPAVSDAAPPGASDPPLCHPGICNPTVESGFTVLGASGYVGSALVAALELAGHRVRAVTRGALPALLDTRRDAGHVIDCIGLTGDFRSRPQETAEAHVGVTARCLSRLHFDSFLFLSSTRVYARAVTTCEDTPLPCAAGDPADLYNLTKLAGEALCLADPRPTVRVVRLSNVYGADAPSDTFLGAVLAEGTATGIVHIRQSPLSSKDYISLAEVTRLLPMITLHGHHRLYNFAAGVNTSHAVIAVALRRHFGWHVTFAPGAPTVRFRPIEISRLRAEFGATLSNLSADLPTLVAHGQEVQCSPSMSVADG